VALSLEHSNGVGYDLCVCDMILSAQFSKYFWFSLCVFYVNAPTGTRWGPGASGVGLICVDCPDKYDKMVKVDFMVLRSHSL
jgi:hypothetical protein